MSNFYGTPMRKIIHHGRNIRYYRKRNNLNQRDLAEMLGSDWTQTKISDYEKKRQIDYWIIEEFAAALGIKPEDILTLETPHMRNVQKNYDSTNYPTQYNQPGSISPDRYFEAVEKNDELAAENRKLNAMLLRAEQEKTALEREKNELLIKLLNEKKSDPKS